ncbi:EthD family reductase [Halobacillus sp. Nhm2S1]|uniref:EthD family reductase n=1 Tax=Halobacillus sp. Nhm2S1 TaxID=2866716 RepID=UPI001C7354DF|nr:EthD family reductase [Halobacillus sp. Nhm2S1]MBX0356855.1 EthD family reductase [Halobacillus sp. Nhm2S1]
MAKIIVLYERPENLEQFENHYFNVHIPLVKKIPQLKDASVNKAVQTQNTDLDINLVAQLEFESMEDLSSALSSESGKAVLVDVEVLAKFLPCPPIVMIVD